MVICCVLLRVDRSSVESEPRKGRNGPLIGIDFEAFFGSPGIARYIVVDFPPYELVHSYRHGISWYFESPEISVRFIAGWVLWFRWRRDLHC